MLLLLLLHILLQAFTTDGGTVVSLLAQMQMVHRCVHTGSEAATQATEKAEGPLLITRSLKTRTLWSVRAALRWTTGT
jgi:hypothetical protein